MKHFIKILLVLSTLLSMNLMAKKSVDLGIFNKEINKNMNEVIQDNPQLYETKPVRMNRAPASVSPVETTEKLDKFEEQADGHKDW